MRLYAFRKLLGNSGRVAAWRRLGVVIDEPVRVGPRVQIPRRHHNLSIGSGSVLDGRLSIRCWEPVTIGRNVIFNDDVCLVTGGHDPDSPNFGGKNGPISIGDYAWLPMRITVLPGVSIGYAGVIGTGSVVTRDVPDYGIAAGNPARVVRERARVDFIYIPALGWDAPEGNNSATA